MKIFVTERQLKNLISKNLKEQQKPISELMVKSKIVQEFVDLVKDTPGLLKHLKFDSYKRLEEFIEDNGIEDLNELRKEAKDFIEKKENKSD
jgi:hypothetical protein